MKIGILSRRGSLYSTRRLREAAEERGHVVRIIDPLRCYMNIAAKQPKVIYGGEVLQFDAIIPRIGASVTFYGCAVVRQFESQGVFTVARSQATTRITCWVRWACVLTSARPCARLQADKYRHRCVFTSARR